MQRPRAQAAIFLSSGPHCESCPGLQKELKFLYSPPLLSPPQYPPLLCYTLRLHSTTHELEAENWGVSPKYFLLVHLCISGLPTLSLIKGSLLLSDGVELSGSFQHMVCGSLRAGFRVKT